MNKLSISPHEFERGYPIADTTGRAYDAMDLRRAIEAYKFFCGNDIEEVM